ncbi:hypothetical protein DMENIID0001_125770 [Sergentomyia squamirostris]
MIKWWIIVWWCLVLFSGESLEKGLRLSRRKEACCYYALHGHYPPHIPLYSPEELNFHRIWKLTDKALQYACFPILQQKLLNIFRPVNEDRERYFKLRDFFYEAQNFRRWSGCRPSNIFGEYLPQPPNTFPGDSQEYFQETTPILGRFAPKEYVQVHQRKYPTYPRGNHHMESEAATDSLEVNLGYEDTSEDTSKTEENTAKDIWISPISHPKPKYTTVIAETTKEKSREDVPKIEDLYSKIFKTPAKDFENKPKEYLEEVYPKKVEKEQKPRVLLEFSERFGEYATEQESSSPSEDSVTVEEKTTILDDVHTETTEPSTTTKESVKDFEESYEDIKTAHSQERKTSSQGHKSRIHKNRTFEKSYKEYRTESEHKFTQSITKITTTSLKPTTETKARSTMTTSNLSTVEPTTPTSISTSPETTQKESSEETTKPKQKYTTTRFSTTDIAHEETTIPSGNHDQNPWHYLTEEPKLQVHPTVNDDSYVIESSMTQGSEEKYVPFNGHSGSIEEYDEEKENITTTIIPTEYHHKTEEHHKNEKEPLETSMRFYEPYIEEEEKATTISILKESSDFEDIDDSVETFDDFDDFEEELTTTIASQRIDDINESDEDSFEDFKRENQYKSEGDANAQERSGETSYHKSLDDKYVEVTTEGMVISSTELYVSTTKSEDDHHFIPIKEYDEEKISLKRKIPGVYSEINPYESKHKSDDLEKPDDIRTGKSNSKFSQQDAEQRNSEEPELVFGKESESEKPKDDFDDSKQVSDHESSEEITKDDIVASGSAEVYVTTEGSKEDEEISMKRKIPGVFSEINPYGNKPRLILGSISKVNMTNQPSRTTETIEDYDAFSTTESQNSSELERFYKEENYYGNSEDDIAKEILSSEKDGPEEIVSDTTLQDEITTEDLLSYDLEKPYVTTKDSKESEDFHNVPWQNYEETEKLIKKKIPGVYSEVNPYGDKSEIIVSSVAEKYMKNQPQDEEYEIPETSQQSYEYSNPDHSKELEGDISEAISENSEHPDRLDHIHRNPEDSASEEPDLHEKESESDESEMREYNFKTEEHVNKDKKKESSEKVKGYPENESRNEDYTPSSVDSITSEYPENEQSEVSNFKHIPRNVDSFERKHKESFQNKETEEELLVPEDEQGVSAGKDHKEELPNEYQSETTTISYRNIQDELKYQPSLVDRFEADIPYHTTEGHEGETELTTEDDDTELNRKGLYNDTRSSESSTDQPKNLKSSYSENHKPEGQFTKVGKGLDDNEQSQNEDTTEDEISTKEIIRHHNNNRNYYMEQETEYPVFTKSRFSDEDIYEETEKSNIGMITEKSEENSTDYSSIIKTDRTEENMDDYKTTVTEPISEDHDATYEEHLSIMRIPPKPPIIEDDKMLKLHGRYGPEEDEVTESETTTSESSDIENSSKNTTTTTTLSLATEKPSEPSIPNRPSHERGKAEKTGIDPIKPVIRKVQKKVKTATRALGI